MYVYKNIFSPTKGKIQQKCVISYKYGNIFFLYIYVFYLKNKHINVFKICVGKGYKCCYKSYKS